MNMPRSRASLFFSFPALLLFLLASLSFNLSHASLPIKNIVVLVLENRSFDHMLGWMMKSINPSINGLSGTECNQKSTQDPNSPSICVSNDAQYVEFDPGHSFLDIEQQVFGSSPFPTMSGFVQQATAMAPQLSEIVMKGFKPENLPVYTALLREFAVFDRWFSSLPGPTQPNRMFVYSATSYGAADNIAGELLVGSPQKTVFDSLHENALDFGIYSHGLPTTLFFSNLRRLNYVSKFHSFSTFKKHAEEGKLRSLSVIEPRYFDLLGNPANDDHPSHDVANGQMLVKEVYEALRLSPQWNQSLFIITYDEHGGFFDHVSTPYEGVPNPDGINSSDPFFSFDRLGVRVPTMMISPWIKKGTVVSRPNGPTENSEFEHSSIPATIKKVFKIDSGFLTRRDAWAGTFEQVVGKLTSPRTDCPEFLPNAPSLRDTEANENKGLSEFQRELVQLASVLNGDRFLSSQLDRMTRNMTVKEANQYTNHAMLRFLGQNKKAN